jgi:ankyrin repeat domain-containing protein 6
MGRRKLTRILLEAGCEGHVKNAQSESPRDIAQRKKLTEIIEILDTPIKEIKRDRERSSSSSRHNKKSKPTDERDGGAKKPAKTKSTKHVTIAKEANKDSSKDGSKGSGSKDKKSTKDKTKNPKDPAAAVEIDPKNWSPYGCHYFPDPRSFPSPKLETLPPEPLLKGEQYFLDLAGNIKKGPVGIGNTCYCAPFFRHLEQRMSKNRKSIRKYVDRAAEKLDSKVTALAMRTDGQIEVLTR